jgi:predicted dehydrogenase
MTRKARIGLVGAGWWATAVHLPALAANPRAEIVGIADRDPQKAQLAADVYGVEHFFESHLDLLRLEPDGVIVATTHDAHFQPAYDALAAGADVLVEKPLTVDIGEAELLVERAARDGRSLHVGYPLLHTEPVERLRQLVAEGDLGDIVSVSGLFATSAEPLYRGHVQAAKESSPQALQAPDPETYASRARGGGQLLTQATHAASLLFHVTGLEPLTVFALTADLGAEVDVVDCITFSTQSGAVGTLLSTGTIARHEDRVEEFRIFGRSGHAVLNTHEGRMVVVPGRGSPYTVQVVTPGDVYPTWAPSAQLVESILEGEGPVASGALGLVTARFLSAAQRSAELGVPIPVAIESRVGEGRIEA